MEEVLSRHRKEQRDLQSRIMQKKKSATKKTRKSVNDECSNLERALSETQAQELAKLTGEDAPTADVEHSESDPVDLNAQTVDAPEDESMASGLAEAVQHISISQGATNVSPNTGESQLRKPNRQKARLARRAAEQEALAAKAEEEATSIPDLKERERARMHDEFAKRGLREKEIAANGHCMYSAVADQMNILEFDWEPALPLKADEQLNGDSTSAMDYKMLRKAAAIYIAANPDDFVPFLDEPLDEYIRKVRDTGEWGGQLELMALARMYSMKIHVLQGDGRVEEIQGSSEVLSAPIWLAYYKHGFGLGEHYNSLRSEPPTK